MSERDQFHGCYRYRIQLREATVSGRHWHLLTVGRLDESMMFWDEIQEVKFQILGDVNAVQVFPPHDREVDDVNLYHLWFTDDDVSFPYGLECDQQ